jgi:hypothetical protein
MVPKNQNHDTPSIELRTASCFFASARTRRDSGIGLMLTLRSGMPASTGGIRRLTRLPVIASATMAAAAVSGP